MVVIDSLYTQSNNLPKPFSGYSSLARFTQHDVGGYSVEQPTAFAERSWPTGNTRYRKSLEKNSARPASQTSPHTALDDLRYIEEAIAKSEAMLSWENNWDGEGSPGYSGETWTRVTKLIRHNAERLLLRAGTRVSSPDILPGPGGSIDISWFHGKRELLINVPTDLQEPATYYGDDQGKNAVKGKLDTELDNQWLLMWLMQ